MKRRDFIQVVSLDIDPSEANDSNVVPVCMFVVDIFRHGVANDCQGGTALSVDINEAGGTSRAAGYLAEYSRMGPGCGAAEEER